MHMKILLPHGVFADVQDAVRIVADTNAGLYGILPHRLDLVAMLSPGILTYESLGGTVQYVAIDEGVIIKTGMDVHVSVHNAIEGSDLQQLQTMIKQEFAHIDEQEKAARTEMARMESFFIHNFKQLTEHGQ